MNNSTRFFDELSRMMSNATGVAQGFRRDFDGLVQSQVERIMGNLPLAKREELDVVRDMATKAREENEILSRRLAELELQLARRNEEM